ncbi:MAG: acyl-CoA dehydrogenase family protein [Gammaproteobacteria bacterium]
MSPLTTNPRVAPHLDSVRRLAPLILAHADAAERNRRMSREVIRAMTDAGLFRLYLPESLGGSELDPLEFAEILEPVAQLDGSTAWCTWIGNVNTLFSTPLDDGPVERIFGGDPQVVTGSTFFPLGRAERVPGGYRVTGRWSFASGSTHCTWYFVLCQVVEGGTPASGPQGQPDVRACYFPIDKVRIEETWEVSGLAGTGSHDVVLEDEYVDAAFTWAFGPGMKPTSRHYGGALYRYPAYATGVMQVGFIAIGIAEGAVQRVIELAQSKVGVGSTTVMRDRPTFHLRLAEAVALIRSSRAWLKDAIRDFGVYAQAGLDVPVDSRANMLLASTNACHGAARAVDILYTTAGAQANYKSSPLQRALRDVHAATQHFAIAGTQYESVGRMLLGLPPLAPPFILG